MSFRRLIIPAIAAIIVSIVATVVWSASPPPIITYQGKVLVSGSPASTTLPMQFTIYNALSGGTALYTASGSTSSPTNITVTTTQGLFTVYLGDNGTNPIDPSIFKDNDTLYLQVVINGEALNPRKRLAATPYALNSKYLDGNIATSTPTTTNYIPVSDASGNFSFNDVTSTNIYVTNNNTSGVGGMVSVLSANGSNTANLFNYHVDSSTYHGILALYSSVDSSSTPSLLLNAAPGGDSWMAGRLSIGTTTPSGFDLNVVGHINFTGNLYQDGVLFSAGSLPSGILGQFLVHNGSNWSATNTFTTTTFVRDILPSANLSYTLGSSDLRFSDGYFQNVRIGTSTGNDWFVSQSSIGKLEFAVNVPASSSTPGLTYVSTYNTIDGGPINQRSLAVFGSNLFYGNILNSDVNLVSVLNPNSLSFSGSTTVSMGENINAAVISLSGNYVYSVSRFNFFTFDISDPNSPFETGSTSFGGRDIFVSGNHAYVANDTNSRLDVFSINDPNNPSLIASTTFSTYRPGGVYVTGSYVYVLRSDPITGVLSVVDISTPSSPSEIASTSWSGSSPNTIYISGNYAYTSNRDGSIGVIDISNPSAPILLSTSSVSSYAVRGITGSDDYLFVVDFNPGVSSTLYMLDISSSTNPIVIATSTVGINATKVVVSGDYLYVGHDNSPIISVYSFSGGDIPAHTDIAFYGDSSGFISNGYLRSLGTNSSNYFLSNVGIGTSTTNLSGLNSRLTVQQQSPSDVLGMTLLNSDGTLGVALGSMGGQGLLVLYNNAGTFNDPQVMIGATGNSYLASSTLTVGGMGSGMGTDKLRVFGDVNIADNGSLKFNGVSGTIGQILMVSSSGYQEWLSTSSLGISGGSSLPSGSTGQTMRYGISSWEATNNLFITDTGLVGIGTTTPGALLSVSGTATLQNVIPEGPYTGNLSNYDLGASTTRWNSVWANTYNVGSSTWSITQNGTRLGVFDQADGGGNERMTILNNGNVGIGIAAPTEKFSVVGNIIQKPEIPTLYGIYNTAGSANNTYVSGRYAYVADGVSGLQIIDISNPSIPTLIGTYDTPDNALNVYVSGRYAYVADGTSGLQIIDISNPVIPILVGTYNTTNYPVEVYVSGKYAYLAEGIFGLQIIDISNPSIPTLVGTYDTPDYAMGVYVSDRYAYVSDRFSGLQIIDISNPSIPTLVGTYDTPDTAYSVYVSGRYAYVGDLGFGLQIIDISSSTAPTLVGSYDTPGAAFGVYVSGKYAYVADGVSGLQIIDISSSTAPTLSGFYNTPDVSLDVFISGKHAYISDRNSGLQIIDISGTEVSSLIAHSAEVGNLQIRNDLIIKGSTDLLSLTVGQGGLLSQGPAAFSSGLFIASTTPATTTYALYNQGGSLYWNGSSISGPYLPIGTPGQILVNNGTTNWVTSSAIYVNTTTGFIGIGTTSPQTLLSVTGTSTLQHVIPNMFGFVSPNVSQYSLGASTTRWNSVWANTYNIGSSTWSITQTGTRFGVFDQAGGVGNERISILANGNLGVGTTTPGYPLSVQGSVNITGQYLVNGSPVGGLPSGTVGQLLVNSGEANWVTSSAIYVNTTTDYIGMGTTSPGYPLHIYRNSNAWSTLSLIENGNNGVSSTAFADFRIGNYGGSLGLLSENYTDYGLSNLAGKTVLMSGGFGLSNNGLALVGLGSNGNITFYTSSGAPTVGTERMTIATSGYVGIGTTTPQTLLSVNGTSTLQNIIPAGPYIGNLSNYNLGATTTRWNSVWANTYNVGSSTWSITQKEVRFSIFDQAGGIGNERFSILSNGNVGIGTTTPKNKLSIVGKFNQELTSDVEYLGHYVSAGLQGVFVSGTTAYVARGGSGLAIINVSNPYNPTYVGGWNTPGQSRNVYVQGNYAYVADDNYGLRIINVTNSTSPSEVSSILGNAGDVIVSGTLAYVAAGNSYGLQIIDVSNPSSPSVIGGAGFSFYAFGISVSGTVAYVANEEGGLRIVDISSSTNPLLLSTYNTPGLAKDVIVHKNYVYIADGSSGLQIIDVSSSTNPILAGYYNSGGVYQGLFISGDKLYVGIGQKGLEILDISNPINPFSIGIYITNGTYYTATKRGLAVIGGYIYYADWDDLKIFTDQLPENNYFLSKLGIGTKNPSEMLTVSGTANMQNIIPAGSYNGKMSNYSLGATASRWKSLWTETVNIGPSSTWSMKLDASSTLGFYNQENGGGSRIFSISPDGAVNINTIISSASTSLSVSGDINNTLNGDKDISILGSLYFSGNPYDIAISGNYAYIPLADIDKIAIVDISDPSFPKQISTTSVSFFPGSFPQKVFISDKYLYVINKDNQSISILDITNAKTPSILSETYFSEDIQSLAISGSYLYTASAISGNTLYVFDITNPANPKQVATTSIEQGVKEIKISGNYLYTVNNNKIVTAVDITNPNNPALLSTTSISFPPGSLEVSDQFIYVGGGDINNSLAILDITDPANPTIIKEKNISSYGFSDLQLSGRYLYGVGGSNFRIVDVRSSTNPTNKATIFGYPWLGTYNNIAGIALSGKYAYVVTPGLPGANVLTIFNIAGTETTALLAHSAEIGKLQIKNNLTVKGAGELSRITVGVGGILSNGSISITNTTTLNYFGGSIGIGTTSPSYPLTVSGDVNITGDYRINGTAIPSLTAGTISGQTLRWTGSAWSPTNLVNVSSSLVTINNGLNFTTDTLGHIIKPNNLQSLVISGGDPIAGLDYGGDLILNPGNDGSSSTWSGNVKIAKTGFSQNRGKVTIGNTEPVLRFTVRGGLYSFGDPTFNEGNGEDYFDDVSTSSMNQFIWSTANGALRAGYINDYTYWDDINLGNYSVAFGYDTRALKDYSFAAGVSSTANGVSAFALGNKAIASGDYSFAFGSNVTSSNSYAYAFGRNLEVSGVGSVGFNLGLSSKSLSQDNTLAIFGGNVGLNTSTPAYLLTVAGDSYITGNLNVDGTSTLWNTVVYGSFYVYPSSTSNTIYGYVGSDDGSWYSSSDEKLKKNVVDFTGSLEKIKMLRPVSYEFKNEKDAGGTTHIGLLAQELEQVFPQVVSTNKDGLKGVSYANLTPILVKAIQEQQEQIDALKNASTTLTVENTDGQIVYTVDMGQDMLGRPLLNVASIVGVENKWEIDTNGTLISKITTSGGSEKKLYGMSSENIEITLSGTSTLENGEARIVFATDTQEIIDETQPIKVVFSLTSPFSKNIYVSEKSKEGFVLKEVDGTDSGVTFDWMVLAKRKFVDPFVEEIISENGEISPSPLQGEGEVVTTTTTTSPQSSPSQGEEDIPPPLEGEVQAEPLTEQGSGDGDEVDNDETSPQSSPSQGEEEATPPEEPIVESPPSEPPSSTEPTVESASALEAPTEETPVE